MICNDCKYECGFYEESWDDAWYEYGCKLELSCIDADINEKCIGFEKIEEM